MSVLLISVGVPTKPRSALSWTTVMILFFLELIVWLLQACCWSASTISLLKSINTSSTTLIVSLVVTLSPLTNSLLIPVSFNLLLILFPPPWTIIGIKPSLFNTDISLIKISNRFLSTKTLPPHLMTIYSSLYFSKYLLTSSIAVSYTHLTLPTICSV